MGTCIHFMHAYTFVPIITASPDLCKMIMNSAEVSIGFNNGNPGFSLQFIESKNGLGWRGP